MAQWGTAAVPGWAEAPSCLPGSLAVLTLVGLQADVHTQFLELGRFLQLQALSAADSGHYSCTARNAAGSTSVAFQVEIHSECAFPAHLPTRPSSGPTEPPAASPTPLSPAAAPTIQLGPPTVNASVNQTALLPCRATGEPPPLVSWRKDGAPVDPGSPRWALGSLCVHSRQKHPGRWSREVTWSSGYGWSQKTGTGQPVVSGLKKPRGQRASANFCFCV